MQYQKLLDHRPAEITSDTASVDPILGYQFLENGVVHCLPFLSKIWQNRDKELASVCELDLVEAGVQNPADRTAILTSISNYYDYLNRRIEYPEADLSPSTSTPTGPALDEDHEPMPPSSPPEEPSSASGAVQFSECVVCLEEMVSNLRNCFLELTHTRIYFRSKSYFYRAAICVAVLIAMSVFMIVPCVVRTLKGKLRSFSLELTTPPLVPILKLLLNAIKNK